MGYTNSPLVSYTKLSPNNSGTRTENICFFTPHCYVGQASVEDAGTWFAQTETKASCNYMIGKDGRVALIVPESQRSWCSSSKWNDQRAVTVECASNKTHPDASNTYSKGDKVTYKGKTYESTIDNNSWSPEAYPQGWKEITE